MKDIKVSIICNAYNHEKYIRSALESFVNQKTNFAYEVLIHDDASTDGTANIIREYAEKYPEIVKPILQKENQYSQGVKISWLYQYPRAQGEYWAFCEGDDYWCDEFKLQKQYDALEKHPEVDICAHAAHVEYRGKIVDKMAASDEDTVFSVEEVILGGGGFVATNSLMVRKGVWDKIPEYKKILSLDYVNQIQGSLRGGMLYLKDYMAVYRRFTEGSWTSRMNKDMDARINHNKKVEQMLLCLDKETGYRYSNVIHVVISRSKVNLLFSCGKYKEILSKENREGYLALPPKRRIATHVCSKFPWIMSLYKKLKYR